MDKLLLYTQLHYSTILLSWLALSCGLFFVGLVVGTLADTQGVRLKTERLLNNIGFTMVMASVVVFLTGAVMEFTSTVVSDNTQAPVKWFQHTPVQESQFFQKAMLKRKSAVSIQGFATLENQYMAQIKKINLPKHSVTHSGLAAQQHALMFNTTTVTIKTK